MLTDPRSLERLDLTGRTITTFIAYEAHTALAELQVGDRVELTTDAYPPIETDLRAWCRMTGHTMVDADTSGRTWRFTIEKGEPVDPGRRFTAIVSDDGLLELLAPLGFALAAALEGMDVSLYFLGPAVKVLADGHTTRMHGIARPFSRFPRNGLAAAGHVVPQEKLRQIQALGGQIYACAPSMDHFGVAPDDLAFDDVIVAEYLTFMEQMAAADVHMGS